MIRVDNLSLKLGTQTVLNDVSLTAMPGRITVIIGPNGAGKSSLLRAIAGLAQPDEGAVFLGGQTVPEMDARARARRIGYLPQNAGPAWAITVRDLVALGRLPHRSAFAATSARDDAAIEAALAAADLTDLATRCVDHLSGGELARANFARVLAGGTDWILADEPLASLDPPHQRDVLHLLRQAAETGKGVIVVLHQLMAAADCADALVILKSGTVLAAGARDEAMTSAHLSAAFDMPMDIHQIGDRRVILPASPSLAGRPAAA